MNNETEREPITHTLKTDSEVFHAVADGRKKFEIRKADRDFRVGDLLDLLETASTGEEMAAGAPLEYTGGEIIVRVTHVLRGPLYGLAAGWCLMSIEPVPPVALPALTDSIGMVCPTAPERIWLQVDPEPEDEGMPVYPTNPSQDDVTWCWDKINATDTLYIRADLAILAASAAPAPEQTEPTDAMVAVFHDAISGGDTQCDFQNEIKRGLRAVLNMRKGQPNAQDKGHLALPLAGAPCGDEAVERDAAK